MQPDLIITPFGESADPGTIRPIPESTGPSDPKQNASWEKGFPSTTMIPISSGGVPPEGPDMNGVLNSISQHTAFLGGGGQYKWSGEYVAAKGGYAKGAVLQSDNGEASYVSSINNNNINFNTSPESIGNQWLLYCDPGLRQLLSSSSGASNVGTTMPDGTLGTVYEYMVLLEKRSSKSIHDYEKLVVSRPTPSNPETWDWTPAFQASGATGESISCRDQLYLCGPVTYAPGWRVHGEGGGRFLDVNVKTVIRSLNAGESLFTSTASTFSGQREAPSFFDVRLESDFPVKIGDYSVAVTDGGASPYEMRAMIYRCSFAPITSNFGDGLVLVKCFDHIIEGNDITGFARGLIELGSDLGSIRSNRIINFTQYGLLQMSTATFGSQTIVANNEFLGGGVGSTFLKSTSRHARIINNYFERSGSVQVAGFIDVNYDAANDPVLGPNPVSSTRLLSVVVEFNRIDGKANAGVFVYRWEPISFFARIHDTGTSGPLASKPWLTIVGDELPLFANALNSPLYSFKGGSQNPDVWRTFEQGPVSTLFGGVSFDVHSILDLNNSELRRNNAYVNVRLVERGILLKATLVDTLFHCIFRGANGLANFLFKEGVTYNVKVVARSKGAASKLSIVKIAGGAQQGSTIVTDLTSQNTVISTTFTGPASTATAGLAFHLGLAGVAADTIIESVSFSQV